VNNPASSTADIADFELNGTKVASFADNGNLALGVQNATAGSLTIAGGSGTTAGTLGLTSGGGSAYTATLQNLSASAAYNFNLPNGAGSLGNVFLSGGGMSTPNSWTGYAIPSSVGSANQSMVSNGTNVTFQNVSLTAGVSGTLPYANGGTNSGNGAIATLCAGATATVPLGGTLYIGFGTTATSGNEALAHLPVPVSGTVVALHATVGSTPPQTITFHARNLNNYFTSDLTCFITTSETSCDVSGGSQAIAESVTGTPDNWDIEADAANAGTAASRIYAICLKVIEAY